MKRERDKKASVAREKRGDAIEVFSFFSVAKEARRAACGASEAMTLTPARLSLSLFTPAAMRTLTKMHC